MAPMALQSPARERVASSAESDFVSVNSTTWWGVIHSFVDLLISVTSTRPRETRLDPV